MNDNERDGDPVLRVLGRLEATVSAMGQDIAEMKQDANRREDASTESRRRLHEKIESVRSGLQKTDSTIRVLGALVDKQGKDIEGVTGELAALRPTVEHTASTVRNWTIRGGLVLGALAAIGGFLWWGVSTYGVAIWRFLDQFVPR